MKRGLNLFRYGSKSLAIFLAVALLGSAGIAAILPHRQKRHNHNTEVTSKAALREIDSLPQHGAIAAYFNYSQANTYRDPYRHIERPGDNLEQALIEAIASANSTIDVAVQELSLPLVAQALVEKQKQGVRVRLILENSYNRSWSSYSGAELAALDSYQQRKYRDFVAFADLNGDRQLSRSELSQRDALQILADGKINWIDDTADGSAGSGLMHHKFMVIDNQTVILGSANFSLSGIHGDFTGIDSRGNANSLVTIDSVKVAQLFTQEFNYMWGDGPGGKPDSRFGIDKPDRLPASVMVGDAQVLIKFSPNRKTTDWLKTSNGLIASAIAQAQSSVNIAVFVFSDPRIGNLLEELDQRSVDIAVLVDSSFAYREYATTLDMWGYVSTQDCKYGNGRPWARPSNRVGAPVMAVGDRLHHKFAVIDEQVTIIGSHNWSNAANYNNDETLVLIKHPTVAAHFQREFDRLISDTNFGPTAKLSQTGSISCPANHKS
jgi:phosphatidylserine/phosphatidylglycerophosphate/cardiolipin synthase-like enzyme